MKKGQNGEIGEICAEKSKFVQWVKGENEASAGPTLSRKDGNREGHEDHEGKLGESYRVQTVMRSLPSSPLSSCSS